MSIIAFIIHNSRKCPSIDKWIFKMRYSYTMEYYSALLVWPLQWHLAAYHRIKASPAPADLSSLTFDCIAPPTLNHGPPVIFHFFAKCTPSCFLPCYTQGLLSVCEHLLIFEYSVQGSMKPFLFTHDHPPLKPITLLSPAFCPTRLQPQSFIICVGILVSFFSPTLWVQ